MTTRTTKTVIGGRPATILTQRLRHVVKARGYYNRVIIRFTDTDEVRTMGAAEFVKWSARQEKARVL